MPAKKSSTTKSAANSVAATPAPKSTGGSSRKSTKKQSTQKNVAAETTPQQEVAAPAPTTEPTTQTAAGTTTAVQQDNFFNILNGLRTRLVSLEKESREVRSGLKSLETEYKRKSRQLEASQNKKYAKTQRVRKTSENRVVSGIARPTQISSELAKFLNCDPSKPLARTEAIKGITAYIKANNLENPEYRRQIIPDVKLGKLLNWETAKKEVDALSYFNIQKFLKHHFPNQHGEAPVDTKKTSSKSKTN
jgi:chromatin remodeling complex protein RSC6